MSRSNQFQIQDQRIHCLEKNQDFLFFKMRVFMSFNLNKTSPKLSALPLAKAPKPTPPGNVYLRFESNVIEADDMIEIGYHFLTTAMSC